MDEPYYKVKEDSHMHDSSMGTNQSERSGSTFSLPGNWGGRGDAGPHGGQNHKNNILPWFTATMASPKS